MPVEWNRETERLVVCRISGELSYEEWDRLNRGEDSGPALATPEHDDQKLRVMIVLDNFLGWDNSERWEDLDWVAANDRRLQRMAFVGDERWRDRMEIFALKGMRPVEVEYFGPGQEAEARRWLERS